MPNAQVRAVIRCILTVLIHFILQGTSGNILPWPQSNWTLNGDVHKSLINQNELCQEDEAENYVIFPQRQSWSTSRNVCLKLGKLSSECILVFLTMFFRWRIKPS